MSVKAFKIIRSPEVIGVVTFVLLLELLTRAEFVPAHHLPPFSAILVELGRELTRPATWAAIGYTLYPWALGLSLSVILAVPIGILLGISTTAYAAFRPVIEFLRPVPPVALIPVAVLVYGNTQGMKVFLIVLGCFWPLLIQSIYGVRDVDPVARDMFKVYRLSGWHRAFHLVLPTALPYIMTGLRIASTIAIILAIGAEIIVGVAGLGAEINLAQSSSAVTSAYALVLIAGVLGLLVNLCIRAFQRTVLHWHPAIRGEKAQ